MTPERKAYLSERRKQHNLDKKHAQKLETIVKYPMDLPSLEKAMDSGKAPFLSTGYDWLDKPHRVAWSAIDEIRKLRAFIVENLFD